MTFLVDIDPRGSAIFNVLSVLAGRGGGGGVYFGDQKSHFLGLSFKSPQAQIMILLSRNGLFMCHMFRF